MLLGWTGHFSRMLCCWRNSVLYEKRSAIAMKRCSAFSNCSMTGICLNSQSRDRQSIRGHSTEGNHSKPVIRINWSKTRYYSQIDQGNSLFLCWLEFRPEDPPCSRPPSTEPSSFLLY